MSGFYGFSQSDVKRISAAVRWVEQQNRNTATKPSPHPTAQAPSWGWETYIYFDKENGGLRVHTLPGWRLVIGSGYIEKIEDTDQDWKLLEGQVGYVWMRYSYANDEWIDSRAVYAGYLPDDTQQVRTLLIAVVDWDNNSKRFTVRQCRNICEVNDIDAIDDESYSSFSEESYSEESESSQTHSSQSGESYSSFSDESTSGGLTSSESTWVF